MPCALFLLLRESIGGSAFLPGVGCIVSESSALRSAASDMVAASTCGCDSSWIERTVHKMYLAQTCLFLRYCTSHAVECACDQYSSGIVGSDRYSAISAGIRCNRLLLSDMDAEYSSALMHNVTVQHYCNNCIQPVGCSRTVGCIFAVGRCFHCWCQMRTMQQYGQLIVLQR